MLQKLGIFPNKNFIFDPKQRAEYISDSLYNKNNKNKNYLTQENFRQIQKNKICVLPPSSSSVIKICTPNPNLIKKEISKEALIFNDNINKFIIGSSNNYNTPNNKKRINYNLSKRLTTSNNNNKSTNLFQLSKTPKRAYSQLNKILLNINLNQCEPFLDSNEMGINIIKNSNLSFEEILRNKFNKIKELSININNINDKIHLMQNMINNNYLKNTKIRNSSVDILNKSCVTTKNQKYIIGDIPILKDDIMKIKNKLNIVNNELEKRNLVIFRENLRNNLMVEDINKFNSLIDNVKDDILNIKNYIFLLRKQNINMKKKLKIP